VSPYLDLAVAVQLRPVAATSLAIKAVVCFAKLSAKDQKRDKS